MKTSAIIHSRIAATFWCFLNVVAANATVSATTRRQFKLGERTHSYDQFEVLGSKDLRSTRMNVNLTQNEARKTRCCRKCTPSRWYSAQMNIALMIYPALATFSASLYLSDIGDGSHMKSSKNPSCRRWWCATSKTERSIKPHVPAMADITFVCESLF